MRAVWKTAVCAPLMGMALPLSAWAQLAPPASPPAALRDPSEQLRREQQQRERTPVLRPEVAPATEPKSDVSEERDAPFPENLGKPDEPTFAIREIVLSDDADNRLIDRADFRRIAAHFEGRRLGVEQINALLNRLTRSLVASGYITSRAAVVEQSITNGTLVVRVQAGRVEEIRYNGHDVATHDFGLLGVRMALPMAPGDVLRLQDIEQAVDQINRLRRNSAQVQIKPGNQAGGSVVEITNTPGDARSYSLSIDNHGSAGTGLNRIQAGMEQGNALGLMESVSLGLVTSTETNAIFGTFSLPLGYYTLSVMRSWSEYQNLVGDTALVYGTSNSTSLALNRLLARSQDAKLAMDLSLTKRRSARAINNLELTPQNQAVARLGINRLSRFQTKHGPGQWTFDVGVVRGLSGLGADRDAIDLPDGGARAQFTKFEGNASLQYALGKTWNWRSRLAAQWSRTPLYSSEQLFAGGVSTVRGFAESAVGGDRGVSLRNEWVMQGVPAPFDGRLFGQTLGIEPYLFLDGDRVSLSGNAVDLQAVDNALHSTYHADSKSLTIGARPAGVLGTLVNTVTDAYNNHNNGSSDRLAAASALKAGYDVYKFVDSGNAAKVIDKIGDGSKDPTKASIGVSVSINSSKSSQDSEANSNKQRGTNIQASNIDVTANEGDITMKGAKLQAENIALDAARDIKLGAAQSGETIKSSNKSNSAGFGVTFGIGEQSGFSFQISAAQAKGHANGSETVYDNTQVLASNNLSIKSGGNTELKGAQLAGKTVKADIGGDLKIETLQDQSTYQSEQKSSGFDISICPPVICAGAMVTGSVNVSKTSIDHSYRSAVGQSGIAAGEGGYDIKVAGNTDLKGGAITSAAPKEKNSLQTKSLTFSDLDNKQTTDVSASSFSAGYGGGSMLGTVAANAGANLLGNTAAKAGLPESGSQSSQTQSVISSGSVVITGKDEGGTSQQAANTLTSRDATTANQALKNNLTLVEAQDIQKNQQKAQDDIKAAGILGSIGAQEIGDLAAKKGWVEGSAEKVMLHGLLGAGLAVIGGGSAGTGFVTGAANELAVGAMGDFLDKGGIKRGTPEFNEMMKTGSALLGTVVGKAAGGTATDIALSGQTAKVATQNNFLKHDQAASMKKDFDQCKAKTGGCSDDDTRNITQKYLTLSQTNIDAVNAYVVAGDVNAVNNLLSQAATAGEVDRAVPVGSAALATDLMGRQNNVNNYGSVRGAQSLFGTDAQQAAQVAEFRRDNCAGLSQAACTGLVNQAIDDRNTRVGVLMLAGAGAGAVGSLAGVRLQAPKGTVPRGSLPLESEAPVASPAGQGKVAPVGANGGVVPSGFANANEFANFGGNVRGGLKSAGYPDVEPILQGSAVTGKSFGTGAPFDVGRVSDFDVALASPSLLQRAQELGIGVRSGGTRTGPLSRRDLEALGLTQLASELSAQAGRKVSFMIYQSPAAAVQRAPSISLPGGK